MGGAVLVVPEHLFDTGGVNDKLDRLQAHVAAQHWNRPRQDLRNAQPIPPRHLQHDCDVLVRAHLIWTDDGPQTIHTLAYAWTHAPRLVLVQIDDRRHRTLGAWLPPWDVTPPGGIRSLWTTTNGTALDAAPWDG